MHLVPLKPMHRPGNGLRSLAAFHETRDKVMHLRAASRDRDGVAFLRHFQVLGTNGTAKAVPFSSRGARRQARSSQIEARNYANFCPHAKTIGSFGAMGYAATA